MPKDGRGKRGRECAATDQPQRRDANSRVAASAARPIAADAAATTCVIDSVSQAVTA